MKTFFHIKDNILDIKMKACIESKQFSKMRLVKSQINEVVTFFAANFTEGKRQKAINLLDNNNQPLRKKDAVLLTYFAGVLTMISLLLILLFAIPYQSGE